MSSASSEDAHEAFPRALALHRRRPRDGRRMRIGRVVDDSTAAATVARSATTLPPRRHRRTPTAAPTRPSSRRRPPRQHRSPTRPRSHVGDRHVGRRGVPQRIVSLSPTATEMLFAIGAGDQVIAVDDSEQLSRQEALQSTHRPVRLRAERRGDRCVRARPRHPRRHDRIWRTARRRSASPAGPAPRRERSTTSTPRSSSSARSPATSPRPPSWSARCRPTSRRRPVGRRSAFDVPPPDLPRARQHAASASTRTRSSVRCTRCSACRTSPTPPRAARDYPQLSAEFIISQNPDIIFLADANAAASRPRPSRARPGWDVITAVQAGHVVPVDDDIASRWGPRVVEYVQFVADAVNELRRRPT